MSKAREEKQLKVKEIAEKFSNSKEVVLVDYRGLTVKDLAELRAKLRESDVDFKVYKNTLTKLATKESGKEGIDDLLEGPTALAFVYGDEAAAPKTLVDFAKDHKTMELKGGLLGEEVISTDQIKSLASLPGRDQLIAQAVGTIAGPIKGLLYVLNGPIESFARVVRQIQEQAS